MRHTTRDVKPHVLVGFIFMLFLLGATYTTNFFKQEVIAQQQQQLLSEINLLTPYLLDDTGLKTEGLKVEEGLEEQDRLTLMDNMGVIVYDSSHEKTAVGSRKERPEIKAILDGTALDSSSVRASDTIGDKYIYVAKAIYIGDNFVGIVRLSQKYTGITQQLRQFQRNLFSVFLLLSIAVLSMYVYILRQNRKPIQFILPILKQAIKNPEKKLAVVDAPTEWQELYQTVYELMDENKTLYNKRLQSEAKMHFLFEQLDIGMFILNDELDIVMTNKAAEKLFGSTRQDPTYKEWLHHTKMIRFIETAQREQREIQGDIVVKRGGEHYINVAIRLLTSGNKQEYVGILYDVTPMRQMELVHEDFISNISHELKTPTTSIIGFAETLLAGAKDEPEVLDEFLGIIEKEGQRLLVLIENIMMLLKTEQDIHLLDTLSISPTQVIEEEIERYRYRSNKKNIDVVFDSSVTQKINFPGNAFQLIVKNLLENAIAYTDTEGKILMYLKEQENELVFTIEDTGIGISLEDQERIFERFYRVSASRQRYTGGSGLGLSIVQHYTEILNGTVKLVSDLGEGTTVIVRLPIEK